MPGTKDFAEFIRAGLRKDTALFEAVEQESFNADIAQKVYKLRTAAKLTQKQLAQRIGTHQSVISRLEDADYSGHSLALLKRIAKACGQRLRIEFARHPDRKNTRRKSAGAA